MKKPVLNAFRVFQPVILLNTKEVNTTFKHLISVEHGIITKCMDNYVVSICLDDESITYTGADAAQLRNLAVQQEKAKDGYILVLADNNGCVFYLGSDSKAAYSSPMVVEPFKSEKLAFEYWQKLIKREHGWLIFSPIPMNTSECVRRYTRRWRSAELRKLSKTLEHTIRKMIADTNKPAPDPYALELAGEIEMELSRLGAVKL